MRGIYETLYSIHSEDGPKTDFCKVAEAAEHYRSSKIDSTSRAKEFALTMLGNYFSQRRDQEQVMVVVLDTKNHPLRIVRITRGTLDASLLHPREVFRVAVHKGVARIAIVHNHPSGDPTPSREDHNVTESLKKAGQILGIDVVDSVVIGNGTGSCASIGGSVRYFSVDPKSTP